MSPSDAIQAPVAKAALALGAGAGSSASALLVRGSEFLPNDLAGWLAAAASAVALGYTLTLWGEWWWKKFWKPLFKSWGWMK